MDPASLPPPPADNFLGWALQHPAAVQEYMAIIYALSRLQVEVIDATGVSRKGTLRLNPGSAIIQIRLS